MEWPTKYQRRRLPVAEWAEPARKKGALFNTRLREEAEQKKLKTPRAAGSSGTPITEEVAAAASSSYAGPAVPIQLAA